MRPRRLLRRGPALLGLVLLSSCGGRDGPQADGPLGGETGRVSLCASVAGTAPVVAADEHLRNTSAQVLTVDDVRLVDPEGLRLRDASLLPIRDRTLLGTTPSRRRAPSGRTGSRPSARTSSQAGRGTSP